MGRAGSAPRRVLRSRNRIGDGLQLARLMAIRFDGEDERHYIRTMKSVSMAAAIAKISNGACARL